MDMSSPELGSAVTDASPFNAAMWTVIVGAGSGLVSWGSCINYVSGRLVLLAGGQC